MKLEKLHKKLAMRALDPDDPMSEACACSVGWVDDGKSETLKERFIRMNNKKPKFTLKDKDGNIKQEWYGKI
tara:strand:+ start:211 stop:426 length:216 start_codon:yes stop_codon:yes gene_type:complete